MMHLFHLIFDKKGASFNDFNGKYDQKASPYHLRGHKYDLFDEKYDEKSLPNYLQSPKYDLQGYNYHQKGLPNDDGGRINDKKASLFLVSYMMIVSFFEINS